MDLVVFGPLPLNRPDENSTINCNYNMWSQLADSCNVTGNH